MSLFKPSDSSLYYYKFMYKGQMFYGPTGEAGKRKAQKIEERAKEKVKRDHLLKTPTALASAGAVPTWEECVDEYLKRREEEGGIVNQEDDETAFDRLTDWIGADTPIRSITEEIVRVCVRKRAAMPKLDPITKEPKFNLNDMGETVPDLLSVATVNRQTRQLIRRIHEFAGKKLKVKNLEVVDWGDIARSRPEPVRTQEITLEEEERIMALSGETSYGAAYRFGVLSGLRWQALCNLTWGQVNFETMDHDHQQAVSPPEDGTPLLYPNRLGDAEGVDGAEGQAPGHGVHLRP